MSAGTDPVDDDRRLAHLYDVIEAPTGEASIETVVGVLKELSRGGPVLELGVGSGRVALPLAAAGVSVTGIESSQELLDVLRTRRHGRDLPVLFGNFRDLEGGPYHLIYALESVFWQLREQDDQVACFANVSQALAEDGIFLVETARVPFRGGTQVSLREAGEGGAVLRVGGYDDVHQTMSSTTLAVMDGQVRTFPTTMRYTVPAELDLMARIAGLTFLDRWGTWDRSPVTSGDVRVISLYQLRTGDW